MTTKAEWTFMVFMAGDNNLSAAGDRDLVEMRKVGSTDAVNVVVEFDNAGNHGTRRIHIKKDGNEETVKTLGETDSGSPEVLSDFIAWTAKNYPAERYALILWNHGGGWKPDEVERIARSVNSPDFSEHEGIAERSSGNTLGSVFFRSSLERVLSLNDPAERAILSDDGSGHSLDTIELHKVIAQGANVLGQPFDLLGMDACLMSNLEVIYQLRDDVRYICASEDLEPNQGWPYDRVLSRLVADPAMAPATLASHIVSEFVESYVDSGSTKPVTQSAFDLSRIKELIEPLDALADHAIRNMDSLRQAIWSAQINSTDFLKFTLRDIGHFCKELSEQGDDEQARAAAAAVVEAHKPGAGRPIIAEAHRGSRVENCHGLTAYFPMKTISRYYEELAFAKDLKWFGMLKKYFDV